MTKLKVPKNRVMASASPPNRSSATTLNWKFVHWVAIATSSTSAASSRR